MNIVGDLFTYKLYSQIVNVHFWVFYCLCFVNSFQVFNNLMLVTIARDAGDFPFELRAVQKDGLTCAWCPWYR